MIKLQQYIATAFGIGYIGKGSGTIAAAAYCILWLLLPAGDIYAPWQVFITMTVTAIGVWCAGKVDAGWGKDSSKVVIDEVAGMMITLLFIPVGIRYAVTGLILFRFFDIVKPFYIKRMERLPKGWGVMADDVLAGIYANVLLQAAVTSKLI